MGQSINLLEGLTPEYSFLSFFIGVNEYCYAKFDVLLFCTPNLVSTLGNLVLNLVFDVRFGVPIGDGKPESYDVRVF